MHTHYCGDDFLYDCDCNSNSNSDTDSNGNGRCKREIAEYHKCYIETNKKYRHANCSLTNDAVTAIDAAIEAIDDLDAATEKAMCIQKKCLKKFIASGCAGNLGSNCRCNRYLKNAMCNFSKAADERKSAKEHLVAARADVKSACESTEKAFGCLDKYSECIHSSNGGCGNGNSNGCNNGCNNCCSNGCKKCHEKCCDNSCGNGCDNNCNDCCNNGCTSCCGEVGVPWADYDNFDSNSNCSDNCCG